MARSKSTRWYAALAVLLAFVLLAWLLGGVLTLTEGERVALRVGLVVLGLVAAGSLLWFLRPVDEPIDTPAAPGRDDALAAVAAARARLPRGALDAKPDRPRARLGRAAARPPSSRNPVRTRNCSRVMHRPRRETPRPPPRVRTSGSCVTPSSSKRVRPCSPTRIGGVGSCAPCARHASPRPSAVPRRRHARRSCA